MDILTDYDKTRYNRQMLLEGWGQEGQLKLKRASVFIAGAGGLGSPVAIYLAVAGVGEIKICDSDRVELSNLNRQILHADARIGQLKAESAAQTLRQLNPAINIVPCAEHLDPNNIARVIGRPDIIIDCLDNFETRYLLNTYCIEHHLPFVHGAVWGLVGQTAFLHPPETPCLRCIFKQAPPKTVFPVVGATPGLIGSLQAMQALKYLTGVGDLLKGSLLFFDGEDMTFAACRTETDPACPECSHRM